jgi:hypothetical protein
MALPSSDLEYSKSIYNIAPQSLVDSQRGTLRYPQF